MSSEEDDVDRATAAAEEARKTIAQARKVRAVARALCEASRRLRAELRPSRASLTSDIPRTTMPWELELDARGPPS
jgi:hypothetical protein